MGDLLIRDVICPSCVNLHLKATTKDEVIREMTEMLWEAGIVSSKEGFIKDVYIRESEGETGLGGGVAIPHGKSDFVIKTSIAVGRCDCDVEWESIGEGPTRLIILFAVNSQDKSQMVSLLAQVAVALCDESVIEQLLKCEDAKEVLSLLNKKEVKG